MRRSDSRTVLSPRFLQGKYQPDKLLDGMGNRHVVVLTFRALLFKIGFEGRVPNANELCGIEKGIPQVFGSSLFHMGI